MGFYVFTTTAGVHFQHDDDPISIVILDDDMKPIGEAIKPAGVDYECAESVTMSLFAIGYWMTADLTVFDLTTGEKLASFPFRKLETVSFDETGRNLFFKSNSNVFLLDVKAAFAKQIKGVLAFDRQIPIKGRNEVLVGSQRKGELLRISLKTGSVVSIPLAIDATFFDLKQNPCNSEVILIDRKKGVHCVDVDAWRIMWSISLKKEIGKDHAGVGQFSGNGKFFGVAVAAYDRNYTVVLDAGNRETVRRIDRHAYGLPWRDNIVRDNATKRNSYEADGLDMSTGMAVVVSLKGTGQQTNRLI